MVHRQEELLVHPGPDVGGVGLPPVLLEGGAERDGGVTPGVPGKAASHPATETPPGAAGKAVAGRILTRACWQVHFVLLYKTDALVEAWNWHQAEVRMVLLLVYGQGHRVGVNGKEHGVMDKNVVACGRIKVQYEFIISIVWGESARKDEGEAAAVVDVCEVLSPQ